MVMTGARLDPSVLFNGVKRKVDDGTHEQGNKHKRKHGLGIDHTGALCELQSRIEHIGAVEPGLRKPMHMIKWVSHIKMSNEHIGVEKPSRH